MTVASLAFSTQRVVSNACLIDTRGRGSADTLKNRLSRGIFPCPPDHRSPSPKGWLRIVNRIPKILLDQDDSDVNLGERGTSPSLSQPLQSQGLAAGNTISGIPKVRPLKSEIGGRNRACSAAAAPRIAGQMQSFAEIHCRPIQGHGAAFDQRHCGNIEAEPRQERVAAAVGPDLDSNRRTGTEAARVETYRIGHY